MIVVDKYGLPIESQGSLNRDHAGIMSSIMKNASRLNALLQAPTHDGNASASPGGDGNVDASSSPAQKKTDNECTAKIQFKNESLVIR